MSTTSTGFSAGMPPIQIPGLASGLDTNSIIQQLLAIDRQPIVHLTNRQQQLQAQVGQLQSTQSGLQNLVLAAQSLGSPALWATSQTASSSNPSLVTAAVTSGAGVGGHQVGVSQLANSANRTFTFTSPTSSDTFTIDGNSYTLAAGASISDLTNVINSDPNGTVWAASTNANTVVFSDRATGLQSGPYIQVADPAGSLVEQTALANAGQNALYTIDGGAQQSSASNTVTSAIAGVTLTFQAVTTTQGPVTINVGAPQPNAATIQGTVNTFVSAYNAMIDQINTQLTQKPVPNAQSASDLGQGTLFGDDELTSLLSNVRESIYSPIAGLPSATNSLASIGVTTGAPSGSAQFSQDSVQGHLTVDANALSNAIQTNPDGVKQLLEQWSTQFANLVNVDAAPGGILDTRISGDGSQISSINDQITSLNASLAQRQQSLVQQFAALEGTLAQSQSQGQWLSSQIASLP